MIEAKDTQTDVRLLLPLRDCWRNRWTLGESDLIKKLLGLLTEATKELRLNREVLAMQQEETAALREEVAKFEELVT